ncbi:MAG: hypothetical protein V4667_09615 [Bacteroidota bacterium]
MKKITLFFVGLVTLISSANAQTPAFPTGENAVLQVKNSYLLKPNSVLTTEYGVKDFSQLKVTAIAYSGDKRDVQIPSDKMFISKSSDRAKELFVNMKTIPEDECYTVVTITTPKGADGIYYDINVKVSYSRLKNDALTNNWELDLIQITYPFIRGLVISDQQKETAILEALREYTIGTADEKFTLKNGTEESSVVGLKNVFKINSITPSKTKVDNAISANELVWYFDCDALCYADFEQVEDGMTMKDSDTPSTVKKPLLFISMQAKRVNNKWVPTQISIDENGGTEVSKFDGKYNAVFKNIGIDGVYKKSTPSEIPSN